MIRWAVYSLATRLFLRKGEVSAKLYAPASIFDAATEGIVQTGDVDVDLQGEMMSADLTSIVAKPTADQMPVTRERKLTELRLRFGVVMEMPFLSSALGTSHAYRMTAGDQSKLLLRAFGGGKLLCAAAAPATSAAAWIETAHTVAQVRQVITDLVIAQEARGAKFQTFVAALAAAQTPTDVSAINWKKGDPIS